MPEFKPEIYSAIKSVADSHGVSVSALAAVTWVESGGIAYARINGVNVPLIRIEGHYFDKLVAPEKRQAARDAGLASPTAGAVKNPAGQEARYRIFQKMLDLDRDAAIASVSWGVGQVMGVHWQKLGFQSPEAFRLFVMASVKGQIEVMARFIESSGLLDELLRQDWAGFARGYNGPGYRKNAYDTKLRAAFEDFGGIQQVSPAAGMLRMGSRGAGVREVQTLLVRAGYAVNVDGDFGQATKDALIGFQRSKMLDADGVAGPKTMAELKAFQMSPAEKVGFLPAMEVPQVNKASKAAVVVAFATGFRNQVSDIASSLLNVNSETASAIANTLLAGSGAIGVGLAAYAFWGWWQSGKTVEQ